jgi:hypothetical protein
MKTLYALIFAVTILWYSPVSAKYCTFKSETNKRSCLYKIDRIENNSQIVISYTSQGWSMMIAVFLKEFAMLEGEATVKPGRGEDAQAIEYVATRRDMTYEGLMMEAPIYKLSEDLLHQLGKAKGKVRFFLVGESKKEIEVEVAASLFSDIEDYIAETKTELGVLFKDK